MPILNGVKRIVVNNVITQENSSVDKT